MLGHIIILDGLSNCGKTTLSGYLEMQGYCHIEEAPSFIRNNSEYSQYQLSDYPKNENEEIRNQNILFKAEIDRLELAIKRVKEGKNVVMDRSFYGTVAFAEALDIDSYKMKENIYNLNLKYIGYLDKLSKMVDIKHYLLFANFDIIRARNYTRTKPLGDAWINSLFLKKQFKFYTSTLNLLPVDFIDTSALTLEDSFKLISGNSREGEQDNDRSTLSY